MGNFASYFSNKASLEEFIGKIDENPHGNHHTPTRCPKTITGNPVFDPRSPTLNIERTPIVVEKEIEKSTPEDPRSPSFGITRTPVSLSQENEKKEDKEREELKQVLNFTDLDALSLSNIEDISVTNEEEASAPPEETIDFSSLIIAATSTPAPSPVKLSNKARRPAITSIVDENSFGKSNSPQSVNALVGRPRVPFGDVNRPSLASPRLQLQNKQRHIVRSEIIQHQQRYSNKID